MSTGDENPGGPHEQPGPPFSEVVGPIGGPIASAADRPFKPTLSKRAQRDPDAQLAPITAQIPIIPTPPLERAFNVAHRWRTVLGLALAAVITGGVVIAYQNQDLGSGQDVASLGDGERSAIAAMADFSNDNDTPAGPATSGLGDRQVDSEVDRRETTSTTRSSTTATTPTTDSATTASSPTTTTPSASTAAPATTDTTASGTETSAGESTTSSTSTDPSTTVDPSSTTSTTAPVPVRIEAESGQVLGTGRVRADHAGFSGTGFVGDLFTEGSGVTITINSPSGGDTMFTIRYAAGENGPPGTRTLTMLVDDVLSSEAQMNPTGAWDTWDIVVGSVKLAPGANQITLIWGENDTGWVNIDYVEVTAPIVAIS